MSDMVVPAAAAPRRPWPRARLVTLVAWLLGAAPAVAAAMVLSGSVLYPGDLLTFFVPHLAALALAAILLILLLRRPHAAVPAAVALGTFAWLLLAPAPRARAAPGATHTLRVMSFNVFYYGRDIRPLLAFIEERKPDVVVLQEISARWRRGLDALDGRYPWRTDRITGRRQSVLILSRHPIVAAEWFTLTKRGLERRLNDKALLATIDVEGTAVDLLEIHPPTPRSQELWLGRNEYLLGAVERAAARPAGRPLIVAGDTNTGAWSSWRHRFEAGLGLIDAAGTSWPAPTRIWIEPRLPHWLGTPIDRIGVSEGVGVAALAVGPDLGSDHLPIIADLLIPQR